MSNLFYHDFSPLGHMNWKEKPRTVFKQSSIGATPLPTAEKLSVNEFKAKYPDYETGVTTICDPHLWDWIAPLPNGEALWIHVPDNEAHPEHYQ